MAKLKQYLSETDITDDIKGAYTKQADGRYKLNDLSDDHSLVVAQTEVISKRDGLQQQVETLTASVGNLERERDEFKNKAIPANHRAVKKDVAEAGEAALAAGLTAETVKTAGEKITAFESEKAQAAERDSKTKAFKFAEVKNTDEAFKLKSVDDLKIEWKTVDGTEKPFVIGEKDGERTETLFDKKYVSETEGFKGFVPVLFAEPDSKYYAGQESGSTGQAGASKFDAIEREVKEKQKAAPVAAGSLSDQFYNRTQSAAE